MIDSKQSSQFITHLLAHWDLETLRRHYTKKKIFNKLLVAQSGV